MEPKGEEAMTFTLHYWRYQQKCTSVEDSLDAAIGSAWGLRETGEGVPVSIENDAAGVVLDRARLHEAMNALDVDGGHDKPSPNGTT
jgi:hypothetical protein